MQNKLSLDERILLLKSLEDLYKSKNNFNDISYNNLIKLDYFNSSINRYIKMIDIYNDIHIHKTKTVFTVFKLQRNLETLNYAYLYGTLENNEGDDSKTSKIINKYIITSNTLVSKDGMYAHRFINFEKLKEKNHVIDDICNYLKVNIKHKEFKLLFEFFNIDNIEIGTEYTNTLSESTLLIKIYAITWLIELYNMHRNNQEINMNINYNNIMFTEKDKQKFTSLYSMYKDEIYNLVIYYKFFVHDGKNRLEIGQKLIPFNYIQLKEYNNIIHFQWKELLINKIATNLLYNMNSPAFSIFIDWMMINNSNKNLYDNKEVFNKILYSDKIKNILQLLNKANSEFYNIYAKQKSEFIDSLIKKLKKIIKLSENKVLMSNVSLCYLSEYSGRTIFDYFNKIKDKEQVHRSIGDLYTDYDMFQKYLFEIIYSLYCLNLKGIIHGDLHLNNVTLNKKNLNVSNNSKVIYSVNLFKNNDIIDFLNNSVEIDKNVIFNEKDNITFIFKHLGSYPCIIDFSRSFILLKLITENIIEKDKNDVRNKFVKNEQKRIMGELKKIFPNYIKNNSHKLKFLFKNKNFNIMFLYFSAFDIFKFSSNLLLFINKFSMQNEINVNPDILQLLDNISKKAYSYLEKVIDETAYINKTDLRFPNLELLLDFFPSFKFESLTEIKQEVKSCEITDIFTIDNIESYLTIDEMIHEVNENIANNINLNKSKDKSSNSNVDIILKKIQNFTKYEKVNDDLEIELLINKEYYNVKHNLSFVTTSNFTSGTLSSSDLSINNF